MTSCKKTNIYCLYCTNATYHYHVEYLTILQYFDPRSTSNFLCSTKKRNTLKMMRTKAGQMQQGRLDPALVGQAA